MNISKKVMFAGFLAAAFLVSGFFVTNSTLASTPSAAPNPYTIGSAGDVIYSGCDQPGDTVNVYKSTDHSTPFFHNVCTEMNLGREIDLLAPGNMTFDMLEGSGACAPGTFYDACLSAMKGSFTWVYGLGSTPTPIPTPTPTPSDTPTPTPTPTPSDTPTPTPTPPSGGGSSGSHVSPSPTPTPTQIPTPSPTPTPTPSATPAPTPTQTPIPTPSPTVTPQPTPGGGGGGQSGAQNLALGELSFSTLIASEVAVSPTPETSVSPNNLTAAIGGGLTLGIVAINLVIAIAVFFLIRWIIRRKRQKNNWPTL